MYDVTINTSDTSLDNPNSATGFEKSFKVVAGSPDIATASNFAGKNPVDFMMRITFNHKCRAIVVDLN